jgi:NADPH:quinone reductase-like Zn-dependent oxidoreductase
MRALALTSFDVPPALLDLPLPEPGPSEVRVRVRAAGLNGFDRSVASGMVRAMFEYQFPVVLGRDGAGVVDAVGDGVEDVSVAEEVLGTASIGRVLRHGSIAEYGLFPAETLIRKPATLDFTDAAALPIAGAAAVAAVEAADVRKRERVLIAGASGGVGSYAVQLAAARGATVVATGLPEDVERLENLGAAKVVDYREDVAAAVLAAGGKVDALIDLVSYDPETFATFAKAVRSGGTVASTSGGATPEALEKAGLTGQVVMAAPNRATLTKLLTEIERGSLRVDVEQTLPLDAATLAFEAFLASHTRGKIVITVDS